MRTRAMFAASAAAIAIAAAGVAGVASADGPGTPANRTVTVTGDANLAVNCAKRGGDDVDAVSRRALAQALAEAQEKAGFIAGTVGATLGAARSVTENGSAGDPCVTPMVLTDPAAAVTSSDGSAGGVSAPSTGDMPVPEAPAVAPDGMVKPVPQTGSQVWASVTVTYVMG